MMRMQGAAVLFLLIVGLVGSAAAGSGMPAQEPPRGEIGVLVGAGVHDRALNPGHEMGIGPLGGARVAYRFTSYLGWFGDFTWATFQPREAATANIKQDRMSVAAGRAGLELLFWPKPDVPWKAFVTASGGIMDVNWAHDPSSYHPTLASLGVGVRTTLKNRWALRAEVRADRTVADRNDRVQPYYVPASTPRPYQGPRVGATVTDVQALVGFSWLFGGGPKDSDGDGVPDKLDQCPDTPFGWAVDSRGCPLDTDGDGVPDGNDACPDTPKGAKVDAKGCPIDSDGDGVPDGLDSCPDTPKGARVDSKGCPIDSDGDGVPDGIDQCPDTPKGAKVDAQGCPIDSDGDGVPDGIDQCPDTPKGAKVDAQGCPIAAPRPAPIFQEGKKSLILKGVNFETGKDVLTAGSEAILDQVVKSLRDWPDVRIEVSGYTDSVGKLEMNMNLSAARASAVKFYLIEKGIAASRLTSKGYGPANPVADNKTSAGRAENRRVELTKID